MAHLPYPWDMQQGMFDSITKTVYNGDNGGMQWLGLIGAIGGVIGGLTLAKGTSLPIAILTPALMAVGFAWGGSKLGGMLQASPEPGITTATTRVHRPATYAQNQQPSQNIPQQVKAQIASTETAMLHEHVTDGLTSNFSPSASPSTKPAPAAKVPGWHMT